MKVISHRKLEILIGLLLIALFIFYMWNIPIENYGFSSYFIYITSVISMLVFSFNNKHLTAFSIIMMPTELFTTFYLQSFNFNFLLSNEWSFFTFLDASISNLVIHFIPFFIGAYAVQSRDGGLLDWNLYRVIIIIYFMWCYFIDYRFTDPLLSSQFQWYFFGFLIWSTVYAYVYIWKINKSLLIPSNINQ